MTGELLAQAPSDTKERVVTIKVAIADDHSLVRQGLRRYLDTAPDLEVVGEAATGEEALALVEKGYVASVTEAP